MKKLAILALLFVSCSGKTSNPIYGKWQLKEVRFTSNDTPSFFLNGNKVEGYFYLTKTYFHLFAKIKCCKTKWLKVLDIFKQDIFVRNNKIYYDNGTIVFRYFKTDLILTVRHKKGVYTLRLKKSDK